MRNIPIPALLSGLCLSITAAQAAQAAPLADGQPRERLSLSASASTEVMRDVLAVTFTTTKEGSEPGAVQTALKQALDAALAEARKIARPGQVEVQAGNFSLYPRYSQKPGGNNAISGWQGTAELQVQGKDTTAIAQLTGRVASMSIGRVGYSLSNEARDKVEAEVVARAIANYKARATDYARQFGYGGYLIGEVSVNTADIGVMPMPQLRTMKATMSSAADEALPVEAGKATVSVTVNGTIQMVK
ncbi:MAG: SIMPL domain-containing protein [Burkholderiaceae bacterium]